jgi:polyisoprenoid-binding protein YceI
MSDPTTATSTIATRTVDGVDLPAPGTFVLDPAHTHVGFSVRHMMVSKVRGQFVDVAGTITVGEDPLASSVTAELQTASIDTRDDGRDGHLKSADFFDAEAYPTITYRSTSVSSVGKGRFTVVGDLTVRDVTRPVELEVSYEGAGRDPWGNERIGLSAQGEIDRDAFGLTWNQALETGGVLVGKAIRIEIEAEAIRQA